MLNPIKTHVLRPLLRACVATVLTLLAHVQAQQIAPSGTPASEEAIVLSPFTVSTTSDRGYLSTSSATASRVGAEIKDITQSIFVMNGELLNDLAPLDMNDIMRYAPGADVAETAAEGVNFRGNGTGVALVNGFRFPRSFPTDQSDIERVEVLVGPASVLYGNVFGIGGVINRITTQPKFTPGTSLKLQYVDVGDTFKAVVDNTGPFGSGKRAAYRLVVVAQDGGLVMDHSFLNRLRVLPKLMFKLGEKTQLNVEFETEHQRTSLGFGLGNPYDYIVYRTATGAFVNAAQTAGRANTPLQINVPDKANPEAAFVQGDLHLNGTNFRLTSELSDHWSLRVAGLGYWSHNNWFIPGVAGSLSAATVQLDPAGKVTSALINRGRLQQRVRRVGNFFYQADTAAKYDFNGVRLLGVAGLEYSVDVDGSKFNQAPTALPAFDFFNPNYTITSTALVPTTWNETRTYQWGAFAMLQLSFFKDRLLLNGGDRLVDFRQMNRTNASNGPVRFDGEHADIPKFGALYRVTRDIGVYYGHSQAYQPRTTTDASGNPLAPLEGNQDEVGLKLSLFNSRVTATMSAFSLEQANVLETDPNNPGYQIPSGAITTKGYDASVVLSLTGNWQLIGGYSNALQKRTASTIASSVGLTLAGVPRSSWNLWTRYKFTQAALKGLNIGCGTNFTDERVITFASATASALSLPSRQLFDGMVSYNWRGKASAQLNVSNITDKLYYPGGNANRFQVGKPRTVSVSTSYKF